MLGKKKAGDFKDEVILSTYQAIMANYYPRNSVVMSVLHYEMQYAGPKEAIMHAIMRKNFGCTHIIIGRDHAGVGNYYGPYAAQEIFKEFPDLGITPHVLQRILLLQEVRGDRQREDLPPRRGGQAQRSAGRSSGRCSRMAKCLPKEFMRPEVSQAIAKFKHPFVE